MMLKKKKSQNILEYILVLTAIVIAIIIGARQYIKPAVDNMLANSGGVISTKSAEFYGLAGGGPINSTP